MKALSNDKKNSSRDRLLQFYSGHEIILTHDEELLRQRLDLAHKLLRDWSNTRDEIVSTIQKTFEVSKYRAERDIADANYIFGKTYQTDKSFVIGQVIDEIKSTIKLAKELNKLDVLPKLFDNLIKASQQIPNEHSTGIKAKKIYVFNLHQGRKIDAPMTGDDALAKARKMMMDDAQDIEEVTYEG